MSKIFFGYILVFFHIKLNGFDILMDFVGFFLIWQGLRAYVDAPSFQKAKPWAVGLGLVSFVSAFGGTFGILAFAPPAIGLNLLSSCASVYLPYLIDCGVAELEAARALSLGSEGLMKLWKVQAVVYIGASVLSLIPTMATALFVTAAAIVGVVTNVLFLIYLYKAKKTLDQAA